MFVFFVVDSFDIPVVDNVSIEDFVADGALLNIFVIDDVVLVDHLLGGDFRLERFEIRVRRDDDIDDRRHAIEGRLERSRRNGRRRQRHLLSRCRRCGRATAPQVSRRRR